MPKKLQRNFDIIQYLVTNASPEQLTWRPDELGHSLIDIICHLRDTERWHATPQVLNAESANALDFSEFPKPGCVFATSEQTFAEYACYRHQTINLMQHLSALPQNVQLKHKQFGRVTLPELIAKIDTCDQACIRQIEAVIQAMPLNPLMGRAIYEIEQYYRRYQRYLKGITSLLDIGVGSGLALKYVMLQNPHLTIAGVDVRDLRLSHIDVPLQVYDGATLPFHNKQIDVSLLFYVLHHCLNPQLVLDEAIRVTRKYLIIIEEFDDPRTDETSLDLTERQSHKALGLPSDLPYHLFDKPKFETMLKAHHLIELKQQELPSETTRPVKKFLYVMKVV